jgi:hypothetical protein
MPISIGSDEVNLTVMFGRVAFLTLYSAERDGGSGMLPYLETIRACIHAAGVGIGVIVTLIRLTTSPANRNEFFGPRCLASVGLCALASCIERSSQPEADLVSGLFLMASVVLAVVTMHPGKAHGS